jgi:hypothetical protein
MPSFRPGVVLRAIVLLGAVALTSGCLLVPVGPPVVAEPAVVVPAPVIVAPRPAYRFHRGYHGGYWHGHGRGHGRW